MATTDDAPYTDCYRTCTIEVNGERVNYRYWPHRFGSQDHFEFLSYRMSETGYLSHFTYSSVVAHEGGYEAYADLCCRSFIPEPDQQLDLFGFAV